MCREFSENRKKLVRLMCSMACFSEDELVGRFAADNDGRILIDPIETIHDYLEYLSQIGVLRHGCGYYTTEVAPR